MSETTSDTFTWNDGSSGSFGDPRNWTDDSNPTNTGTAVPGAMATITFTTGEVTDSGTVAALSVTGSMTFDAEIVGNSSSNNGDVVLNGITSDFGGGSLDNTGGISGSGLLEFGTITNKSSIDTRGILATSVDNFSLVTVVSMNSSTLSNSGTLTLSGTIGASLGSVDNGGNLNLGTDQVSMTNLTNTGSVSISDGGSIDISGTADLSGGVSLGGGTAEVQFIAGVATVEAGTTVQGTGAEFSATSVLVQGDAGITADGVFIGGTIEDFGTVTGGGIGTGLSALTVKGELTADGLLTVTGPVTITATGTVGVVGGANVIVAAAQTLDVNGGLVNTGSSSVFDEGQLDVHGATGLFNNDEQMDIGLSGSGTVEAYAGGFITTKDVSLGGRAGATGLAVVNAASWTNTGAVSVGPVGSGRLEIENAGTFLTLSSVTLGGSATATGALTVEDAHSLAKAALGLDVDSGSSVSVTNSASLWTGTGGLDDEVGELPSGRVAASVELSTDATWTSTTGIDVGLGTITVDGATLDSAEVTIGINGGSGAGALLSADLGADWSNSGSILVGGNTPGTLTLSGASALTVTGDLSAGGSGTGDGTVMVDGELTTLDVGGDLMVGPAGTGSLDVSHDATLGVDGTLAVGGDSGEAGTMSVATNGSAVTGAMDLSSSGLVSLAGGTLEIEGTASGSGAIGMSVSYLHLDTPDAASVGVLDFAPGDTIDLKGIAPDTVSYSGGELSFTGGGFPLELAGGAMVASASADGTAVTACFATGTRILTDAGEVEVEAVRPGTRVVSLTHRRLMTVRWVGLRTVERASPVRIIAGAFGAGLPHRELWLSPDHAVFVDGVLIPVRYLVNDATIVQERRDEIVYYHVELAEHGVLVAEGLPAESYLDTGNRASFESGSDGAAFDKARFAARA